MKTKPTPKPTPKNSAPQKKGEAPRSTAKITAQSHVFKLPEHLTREEVIHLLGLAQVDLKPEGLKADTLTDKPKATGLRSALDLIHDQISILDEALEAMEGRFSPALTVTPELARNLGLSDNGQAGEMPTSAVVSTALGIKDRLSYLTSKVRDITARVEL